MCVEGVIVAKWFTPTRTSLLGPRIKPGLRNEILASAVCLARAFIVPEYSAQDSWLFRNICMYILIYMHV